MPISPPTVKSTCNPHQPTRYVQRYFRPAPLLSSIHNLHSSTQSTSISIPQHEMPQLSRSTTSEPCSTSCYFGFARWRAGGQLGRQFVLRPMRWDSWKWDPCWLESREPLGGTCGGESGECFGRRRAGDGRYYLTSVHVFALVLSPSILPSVFLHTFTFRSSLSLNQQLQYTSTKSNQSNPSQQPTQPTSNHALHTRPPPRRRRPRSSPILHLRRSTRSLLRLRLRLRQRHRRVRPLPVPLHLNACFADLSVNGIVSSNPAFNPPPSNSTPAPPTTGAACARPRSTSSPATTAARRIPLA